MISLIFSAGGGSHRDFAMRSDQWHSEHLISDRSRDASNFMEKDPENHSFHLPPWMYDIHHFV
jgi:hypothetical protein